jgi:hypothetical protein
VYRWVWVLSTTGPVIYPESITQCCECSGSMEWRLCRSIRAIGAACQRSCSYDTLFWLPPTKKKNKDPTTRRSRKYVDSNENLGLRKTNFAWALGADSCRGPKVGVLPLAKIELLYPKDFCSKLWSRAEDEPGGPQSRDLTEGNGPNYDSAGFKILHTQK